MSSGVDAAAVMPASSWGYRFLLACTAAFLAFMTFLPPGTHLEFIGGMDHSWAYALNYGFHHGLVMGRDLYFTFGPLGFLEHTRMVSNQMLYVSFAFSYFMSALMFACLLHLAVIAAPSRKVRVVNVLLAITLILFSFPEMQRLLMFGFVLVLLHKLTQQKYWMVLLSVTVVLCVLVKFSYGAAALALWVSYGALCFLQTRSLDVIKLSVASLIGAYVLLWLICYGSLSGALGYLIGELYISRGNATAMATNPENNWLAILLFYVALVVAAIFVHRDVSKRYCFLPWVFLLPLGVWTKYSFSQEGYLHFVPLLDFAIFAVGVLLVASTTLWDKASLAALMLCTVVAWQGMHTESVGKPDYYNAPHITFEQPEFARYRLNFHKLFSVWRKAEKERLQPLVLPESMRQEIGDASVDIYPWELIIASVNELNWHPRPAFQVYISYLPYLDAKNRDFFNKPDAPQYIIWHHNEEQDVMNRYVLSSEPMSLQAILNHYHLQYCEGIFCLWKRIEQEQITSITDISTDGLPWNEWVAVPKYSGEILRAPMKFKRTLAGLLNAVFWKEGGVYIDYKLKNGTIKTHELLVENASSGVWIAPYIESYLGSSAVHTEALTPKQRQALLAQPAARGQLEKIEPTLSSHRVIGWALMPRVDSGEQQQYVLLYNVEKAFLVKVGKYDRSDVAAYFTAHGESNTGQCGYLDEIGTAVPDGDYEVRLAVTSRGQWAATPDQGFRLHIDNQNRQDTVEAIRLRTLRPWAFSTHTQANWQTLSFANGVPWTD